MKRRAFHVQVIVPVLFRQMIRVEADSQSVAESEAIKTAKSLNILDYESSEPIGHLIECTYTTEESVMDGPDANGLLRYVARVPNSGDAMDNFQYGLLQADEERGEGRLLATESLLNMDPGQLADCAIDWHRASYSLNGYAIEWFIAMCECKIPSSARDPIGLEKARMSVYEKFAIDPAEQSRTPASAQALNDFDETPLVLGRATKKVETGLDG